MHSLFQPNELIGLSINSNLNNLILESFSSEKINLFIKNKSLYKYPSFNSRAVQYLTWDDSFFSLFKTKVCD
jgi:hypothetical protein